jgi:hypothetical protein
MQLYKYPRTKHLPWSPGRSRDDLILSNADHFIGQQITVTVKMDGETTSLYPHIIHVRSINEVASHPSRDWVKGMWSEIKYLIPQGWRICGENVYTKHSIHYRHLPAYFLVFSIWNEENICLSWPETIQWAEKLGLTTVPVIYQGIYDERLLKKLYSKTFEGDACEGYVIRLSDRFSFNDFDRSVAKYVRPGHVQTDDHWLSQPLVKNLLKQPST